ncbi:DUF3040 domain-containing protein [Corynebacterium choanae]|uniref:DUF3040 domain-containing protein n=1 Tax=Corynebacterium choanae TaxID=1862358 RepID=A0A3G6JAL3_9CORY|nr:DUF3040 domain-containing protein [Corynebacterium choanae]AZA13958.1 hypothetical protein CCHOA_07830 [Corynebacterium choanae]
MALSEHEQRALEEMERALIAEDPSFGSGFKEPSQSSPLLHLRAIALGLVGLVLLIAGVALSQTSIWLLLLSVAGFLLMFGAGVWALRGGGNKPEQTRQRHDLSDVLQAGGVSKPRTAAGDRLGDRMEDNFRRRFGRQ